ncbi:hypothetical protein CTAM01_04088 [Colletotrichum tamarilloi]|uniref:Uncharacterized protein n=1 Tax=Colletotrichum tamarilloi TaxID=1209934 RepID=A0ABQ9RJQ3_9PEZI|nr:uncharacterized protein CTAM01_04088 [Colletotrichum tamarilloi]KAK1504781.1 hypothetical protein CTAM01_04088 [Colletotrichum tamarilloi]
MMSGIKSCFEVKEGVMTLFSSSLRAFQLPFCVCVSAVDTRHWFFPRCSQSNSSIIG